MVKGKRAGKPLKAAKVTRPKAVKRTSPQERALPGMEDHGIEGLDKASKRWMAIAGEQADLRDEQAAVEVQVMALMREHKKTTYRHNGCEIRLKSSIEKVVIKPAKKAEPPLVPATEKVDYIGAAPAAD